MKWILGWAFGLATAYIIGYIVSEFGPVTDDIWAGAVDIDPSVYEAAGPTDWQNDAWDAYDKAGPFGDHTEGWDR